MTAVCFGAKSVPARHDWWNVLRNKLAASWGYWYGCRR